VKTRRKSVTPDGTPGLLCQSSVGRQETAVFSFTGIPIEEEANTHNPLRNLYYDKADNS
jgi:hypothetical protein